MTIPDPQKFFSRQGESGDLAYRLERTAAFFASGAAVMVSPELDLVELAFQFSEDNKKQVERWLVTGKLGKVSDEQATAWFEADAQMWAVVVSPWVLVQQAD